MRKNFIRILAGDKVAVELSPYDLTADGSSTATSKGAPASSRMAKAVAEVEGRFVAVTFKCQ